MMKRCLLAVFALCSATAPVEAKEIQVGKVSEWGIFAYPGQSKYCSAIQVMTTGLMVSLTYEDNNNLIRITANHNKWQLVPNGDQKMEVRFLRHNTLPTSYPDTIVTIESESDGSKYLHLDRSAYQFIEDMKINSAMAIFYRGKNIMGFMTDTSVPMIAFLRKCNNELRYGRIKN